MCQRSCGNEAVGYKRQPSQRALRLFLGTSDSRMSGACRDCGESMGYGEADDLQDQRGASAWSARHVPARVWCTIADAIKASCSAYPFFEKTTVTTHDGSHVELIDGGYCANSH